MNERKKIVYHYEGGTTTDEVEEDSDGDIIVPGKGDVITRKGKAWQIVHLVKEINGVELPIYRLFLTTT